MNVEKKVAALETSLARQTKLLSNLVGSQGFSFSSVTDVAQTALGIEAELSVWKTIPKLIEPTPANVRSFVTRLLLQGADDCWSGRGNDSARILFDGRRKACGEILDRLDSE